MNTAKRANCRVLIIANQKGGVAKSASAVNLSAALALNGKKVLMIDADSQGTGSNMFGIDDVDSLEITLATVLGKIINDEDVDPSEGIIKNAEGVDILPSNIDLAALEASLVNVMNRERLFKTYVDIVKDNYDYIIVDCLPSLGMITINKIISKVFEKMKEFDSNGETYSDIIRDYYFIEDKMDDVDIQVELNIGRTFYYRMKKAAITLFGILLWNIVVEECIRKTA